GYDPFAGYFAGTLYDEEVTITRAFGWARLYHAAGLTLVLAALADHLDAARLALRLRPRGGRVMAAVLVALVAFVTLYRQRADLGFQLDAGDIARKLGAERRTAHFILHYSPNGPFAKDLDLYAVDD